MLSQKETDVLMPTNWSDTCKSYANWSRSNRE